jgi:predicted DCC family thiol-disulfide oxidoreductase YuxK
MESKIIIFYDGICVLCDNTLDYINKKDKNNNLFFSPLQSAFAKKNIDHKYIELMDTVVVKKNNKVFEKSKAAFIILETLNHPLRYLNYFLPTILTDMIYQLIAHKRYNWFGKKEECIFPINNPKFLID